MKHGDRSELDFVRLIGLMRLERIFFTEIFSLLKYYFFSTTDLLTAVHNSTGMQQEFGTVIKVFASKFVCIVLTFFTSLAVFTKALCQLMEVMCGPLLQTLENRLQVNLKRTAALETEKETLEKEVAKLTAELQEST